jgi:DNA helicase-2/ATP-dependent DNA helicase PcrA
MILSEKQLEVVKSKEKHIVVAAGAGSGKTTVLIEHAMNMINDKPINSKILVLTFSNKAANELDEKAKEKITDYQEHLFIGTIHNFCSDMISRYGHTVGISPDFQIFESNDERLEVFTDAIDNFPDLKKNISSTSKPERTIRELFDKMGMMKRNTIDSNTIPESHQQLFEEYNDLMISQNAIDFDDILSIAYKIITEVKTVLRIYQKSFVAVCVDEAQDLNDIQYEIIKTLVGDSGSLFLVGDPNQAIYGFNGSSSKFMLSIVKNDFPEIKNYTLYENYRSSREVLNAAKRLEPQFSLNGQTPINGEFNIKCFEDDMIEANEITAAIKKILTYGHPDIDNPLNPNQICVLARNRYVLDNIYEILKDNNIECTIKVPNSGFSFESPFFEAFMLGLRLILNEKDQIHLNKLIRIVQCSPNAKIDEILSGAANTNFKGYKILALTWITIRREYISNDFNITSFETIDDYCNDENNFSDENEKFMITKEFLDLKNRLKTYMSNTVVNERNLSDLLRSMSLGTLNASSEKGIILSTMHMSKGLEYEVVFIISVNEGIMPDYRSIDETSISEEKHNLFVSITRAKRLCYMSYINKRNTKWGLKPQKQSRFITMYFSDYLKDL